MKSTVQFYLTLVWRRLPVLMLIVLLVSGMGVALAVQLPTIFSTDAKLLVESAQIPDDLAASTVQTSAGEQMEVMQQRLLTRANLIDIANKHKVYPNLSDMTPDAIVSSMRNDTDIRSTSGRDRATLMTISFKAQDPRTAANVVNEYVTLILDENVRYRTDRAGGTQDFFEQEVTRLEDEINIQKERILRFKQANADALPDNLEFRLNRQTLLQERVSEGERRRSELVEQKTRLANIFAATGQLAIENAELLTPEQRQLQALQQELNSALAVYSETNPRVAILKTRITQLESVVKEQVALSGGAEDASALDIELGRIDSQLAFLDRQIAEAESELEEVSNSIARTPANAIALDALERDYENVQNQYNSSVARLAQAQTGERIELLSKGQRVTVVEQATVPNEPTSPNRPRIAAAGMLGGFAIAGGLFLLLELLNNAIRRPKELTTALGITPFAVLPYMDTVQEKRRRRILWSVLIVGSIAAIAAVLWAIQTYYLPLDLVVSRVLDRLGLGDLGLF